MDFSKSSHSKKGIQPLSESVYVGLCKILGIQHQVAMRRDVVDIWNIVQNRSRTNNNEERLCSRSFGEGFRLQGSDKDIMIWPNHLVIWDLSHAHQYIINRCVPILADSSKSPPGFTLLWLPIPVAHDIVLSSCFTLNERFYISSSMYILNACSVVNPSSTIHGPCSRSVLQGFEFDNAHCFACDFWPPSALSWIDRCHSWPKSHVVRDIVRNRCHFVAIGHKLGNYEDDEWRISFSFAEQKLVYSMNHCQFLTYGLLKLFLNEVINFEQRDESKLLCSYHMKTAIFWVLQENKIPHWCPRNFLECFWVCFKLILNWVYEGVCPNFFIPENNMFLTKIHGEAQTMLFLRLYELYENGVACLLQSSSIRPYILNALYNPRSFICLDEKTRISEAEFDEELFQEIIFNEPLPPQ
ncbi:uncharacterized protein LOC133174174 [Saccostrea echinata]|uniref:uncharacterized protein LOC133174174 n=1 Tax=Saccostrea echinata TaxID=191078 RepID=UPI002A8121D0|nr:uncharacterized protein LOC133174174 [Saccostrea echinata]